MSENPQSPRNSNDPKSGASPASRKLSCEEWEALLVDFLDGKLPSSESHCFETHRQSCASCAEMFAQASQGREWLNFLRVEPQVSPALVSKILAQTSGSLSPASQGGGVLVPASVMPIPVAPVLPFWKRTGVSGAGRRVAQPRMLMTAAMAFFSITLTLNMAGVRLTAVRLTDLKPAALSTNLDKQYHMASARVVRYYDNLRFVYEMEARVRELRRDADLDTTPVEKQDQPPASATPVDPSHKNGGKSEGPSVSQPQAMLWGEKVEAGLRDPSGESQAFPRNPESGLEIVDTRAADQAERGIA